MRNKPSAPQRPKLRLFPDWRWEMHCVAAFTAMIIGGGLGGSLWDFRGRFLAGWALALAAKYLLIMLLRLALWLTYPQRMARQRKNGMTQGYGIVLLAFAVFIGLPLGACWLAGTLGIARFWGSLLGILLAVPLQMLLHLVLYFFLWLFIFRKQPWNK